jgi:hypothetical protein
MRLEKQERRRERAFFFVSEISGAARRAAPASA